MRAEILHDMGDEEAAHSSYLQARKFLTDSLGAHSGDPSIHVAQALTSAGLGLRADALEETHRAIELAPLSRATPAATAVLGIAIEVYARLGETDRAFDAIELLLTMPAGRELSVPLLQAWPGFDPLRNRPRYTEIVERFSRNQ
jgi:serine/threonine-protein kinase